MIQFKVQRGEEQQVEAFSLSGHADAGPHGHDIVCAGVSAVSFGAVNAIESLCGVQLEVEMEQDGGFLRCGVPGGLDPETEEKVQLLLEGMLVSIQSIAEEYGKYIKISYS
ncbi:ribosomal-processing cysteine protease Prp [Pseudalkalibacillus caeni]|uniref:Ribosomal processing cysteine protease Prp n=1 Tax=Exobacillus caeni TaxID=2574798 RepID=A0A5R9FAI4_9BACL|nr:ribosomal-processing cysteine protease Prp [Pseudalkalibacillus caeni]TLS39250.1 ribosomal-processing cysteine protease Prp [Pseudalkalibacillus caeni]